MTAYRCGALGPEVSRIQTRLAELGFYRGPVDGIFGGGTESAVRAFQQASALVEDGVVGPRTWGLLFPAEPLPDPAMLGKPLEHRCLALTGSFETGAPVPECFAGLSGDFDGQGLSFGALQWNFGQGSLQPLLARLDDESPAVIDEVFHEHATTLRGVLAASREQQLAWARSLQDDRHCLIEPWRGLFKTLGRRDECQAVQVAFAGDLHERAVTMCRDYGLGSERAVALMFDIAVQNGGIGEIARGRIQTDVASLDPAMSADAAEVERMRIVANRRAEAANPKWVEDVRARKLTIANGEGWLHGRYYDLAAQYGLRLRSALD